MSSTILLLLHAIALLLPHATALVLLYAIALPLLYAIALLLRVIILLLPPLAPLDWGLLYGLGRPSSQKWSTTIQTPSNPKSYATVAMYPRPCHGLVASETPSYFLELTPYLTLVLFFLTRVYFACVLLPSSFPSSPLLPTFSPSRVPTVL